jgi:hydroxymethylglutaryl-CoA reductase (NADPH)
MGLTPAHIAALCRDLAQVDPRAYSLTDLAAGTPGVISRYEPSTREAIIGHRVLTLDLGTPCERRIVLKSKAPGAAIRRRLEAVYARFDPRLAELQHALAPSILDDSHTRELRIYELEQPALRSITPRIELVWSDPAQQIFVIAMELLEDVRLADTLADLGAWRAPDLECALVQIARVHGEFLTRPPEWLMPFSVLHDARLLAYQAALLAYNARTFPDLFTAARVRRLEAILASAPARHRRIQARPLTLIHGDFTPRNVCLRLGDEPRLCAYDWELAQVHLPARDVVELLCYVLAPGRAWREPATVRLLERYRAALAEASGRAVSAAELRHDLALAIAELASFKLLVQGITHQLLGKRDYFERMVRNAFDGIEAFALEEVRA